MDEPIQPIEWDGGDDELLAWLSSPGLDLNAVLVVNLHWTRVGDAGITALAKACPYLQTVGLRSTSVGDAGVQALARCPDLLEVNLSGCGVTNTGVQALARCPRLDTLRLNSCKGVTDDGLMALAVGECAKSLKRLELHGSGVEIPPHLKAFSDAQAILAYVREARDGRPLLEVKVCVLGMGRTGKSQLVNRLAGKPFQKDADLTHPFERSDLPMSVPTLAGAPTVTLRFYDFGGQPELHAAHRFFLADTRNVYVILVSARKSAEENRLQYWLDLARHHGPTAPVIVVVSHNDDKPAYKERGRPSEDRFPIDPKEYPSVRVVNGYSNWTEDDQNPKLEEVRTVLTEAVGELGTVLQQTYNPNFFHVHAWATGGEVPKELEDRAPFEAWHSVDAFNEVCAAAGQPDAGQQRIWLRILRDLGHLHFFGDLPLPNKGSHVLEEYVFHPDWIKKPVYAVVTSQKADDGEGKLTRREMHAILHDGGKDWAGIGDEKSRRRIVSAMEACQLIFRIHGEPEDDDARYLVVDRTPATRPGDPLRKLMTPKLRRELVFDFLPDHLLPQLIGRWYADLADGFPPRKDDAVFRSRDGMCRAHLRADVNGRRIEVALESEKNALRPCEKFLEKIVAELGSILDPEELHRNDSGPLIREVNPDEIAAKGELSKEETGIAGAIVDALRRTSQSASNLTPLAIRAGLRLSQRLKGKVKDAFLLCWVYACKEAKLDGDRLEVTPVAASTKAGALPAVLEAYGPDGVLNGLGELLVTSGELPENVDQLRGNYKKVPSDLLQTLAIHVRDTE
jgi:hypothetical protein